MHMRRLHPPILPPKTTSSPRSQSGGQRTAFDRPDSSSRALVCSAHLPPWAFTLLCLDHHPYHLSPFLSRAHEDNTSTSTTKKRVHIKPDDPVKTSATPSFPHPNSTPPPPHSPSFYFRPPTYASGSPPAPAPTGGPHPPFPRSWGCGKPRWSGAPGQGSRRRPPRRSAARRE
jgi:hypothetical protein